jgi:hypothetical protein
LTLAERNLLPQLFGGFVTSNEPDEHRIVGRIGEIEPSIKHVVVVAAVVNALVRIAWRSSRVAAFARSHMASDQFGSNNATLSGREFPR